MKVLFVNCPNIRTVGGRLFTGPNSGACWPWTIEGGSFHGYAPFPFNMAYGVAWLRHHGIEAHLYDGVADRHADLNQVRQAIYDYRPSVVVFDLMTPMFPLVNEVASWVKQTIESIVVYMGQHVRTYAEDCLKLPYVDHCIANEPEEPILDIVRRYPNGDRLYRGQYMKNVDTFPDGTNFMPYRDLTRLGSYYDPSMQTGRTQLWMNTSRTCPFKCSYCTLSTVSEGAPYRARSAAAVVDEVKQMKAIMGDSLGSIFFDDDTWNLNNKRVLEMCAGLKTIGVPWTMMGRIDTSALEVYDAMVDSGCVGMRFGVETFNQTVLDNTGKALNAEVTYNNIKYLMQRFHNMEFHFTTIKDLPGSVPADRARDEEILSELIAIGNKNGNRVHYQSSHCLPLPSTGLWKELIQLGHGDKLNDLTIYDGHPDNDHRLSQTVGWIGKDYVRPTPKG